MEDIIMDQKFDCVKVGDEVVLTGVEVRGTVTDVQGTSVQVGGRWYADNLWIAEVVARPDNPRDDAVGTFRQNPRGQLFVKGCENRWISIDSGVSYRTLDMTGWPVVTVTVAVEKVGTTPTTTYSVTDAEPPREGRYRDTDGDVWSWDGGWFWTSGRSGLANDESTSRWEEVVRDYRGAFPLTRVEG
jgi:hypothetical protein